MYSGIVCEFLLNHAGANTGAKQNAAERQHGGERQRREIGLLLKQAIDQDPHRREGSGGMQRIAGVLRQPENTPDDPEIGSDDDKGEDTHLVKQHPNRAFDRKGSVALRLRIVPIDCREEWREVAARADAMAEWIADELAKPRHEAEHVIIANPQADDNTGASEGNGGQRVEGKCQARPEQGEHCPTRADHEKGEKGAFHAA